MSSSVGFSVIVGLVFITLALYLLVTSVIQIRQARIAEAWPIASGIILLSDLVERRQHTSKSSLNSVSYEPQVVYEYGVIGKKFTGKRFAFGTSTYDHGTAMLKIAPYPIGAVVQVHYNPDDPTQAILETKAVGQTTAIISSAVFLIIGLVLIYK